MWDGDDGMVHLYGQFDPVTGRRIRNRLNAAAHRMLDEDKRYASGRAAVGGGDASGLHSTDRGRARAGGETRSLQQCMADALEAMTAGTAAGGKPSTDIALVARLDPDAQKLMASTADGDPLPVSVIERLAGESSWFALVLSARGVPMWKGRNIRRATESQFRALLALYGGCAGCGEPDEGRLNAHHMDPFARGGGTDLDNLLPLCWDCHAKVHDHGWQVVSIDEGKHTIRPPNRVHHGPAHLPDTTSLFAPSEQTAGAAALFNPADHASGVASGAESASSRRDGAIAWEGGDLTPDGESRAGPSGPQAARAVLRRALATQRANKDELVPNKDELVPNEDGLVQRIKQFKSTSGIELDVEQMLADLDADRRWP